VFCALILVFGCTKGVGSTFHVLRSQTHFRRYRGRLVYFSYFAFPNSFSAVMRAHNPVFMFYTPELISDGIEGAVSTFHLLRPLARFGRYRGRRVLFSCLALADSFSAVPWALGPIFMFCAPRLVFDAIEGARSYFHVLRSRACFRR
jgi:hypothetical protein